MISPDAALQAAVTDALKAADSIRIIAGGTIRVFDVVPAKAPFPYFIVGDCDEGPDDAEGVAGADVPDRPVMLGGPCGRDRGYVLHTDDYWSPASSLKVAEGVGLTDTREVLDALGDRDRRPAGFVLALGYAGWGAGQLDAELEELSWYVVPADLADPFEDDVVGLARAVLRRQPGDLAWHSTRPLDPGLN